MTSTNDLPHKKPDRAAISPIKFDPQKKESLFGSCPNILPPRRPVLISCKYISPHKKKKSCTFKGTTLLLDQHLDYEPKLS